MSGGEGGGLRATDKDEKQEIGWSGEFVNEMGSLPQMPPCDSYLYYAGEKKGLWKGLKIQEKNEGGAKSKYTGGQK